MLIARTGKVISVSTALTVEGLTGMRITDKGKTLGGVHLNWVWNPGHFADDTIADVDERMHEHLHITLK